MENLNGKRGWDRIQIDDDAYTTANFLDKNGEYYQTVVYYILMMK